MSGYGDFADVYDRLMSDFDYSAAAKYLVGLAKKYGGSLKKPLDLACGSGRLAAELIKLGLDPVCVDGSFKGLSRAKERLSPDTLLICQDMTELDLNDTVDVCFCTMDSINYVTEKTALKKAFQCLSLFTDSGGLFVFDVNGERKFTKSLTDAVYTYDLDDLYLVWNADYDKKTKRALYELTWFSKNGKGWERFDDEQEQRFWSEKELTELLCACDFEPLAAYDAYTLSPASEKSERIHYVFRKI